MMYFPVNSVHFRVHYSRRGQDVKRIRPVDRGGGPDGPRQLPFGRLVLFDMSAPPPYTFAVRRTPDTPIILMSSEWRL